MPPLEREPATHYATRLMNCNLIAWRKNKAELAAMSWDEDLDGTEMEVAP